MIHWYTIKLYQTFFQMLQGIFKKNCILLKPHFKTRFENSFRKPIAHIQAYGQQEIAAKLQKVTLEAMSAIRKLFLCYN